jgi:hypothetical protein
VTRVAYLDESQRPGRYTIAAMAVDHAAMTTVRRRPRAVAPRGVARRHFVKESDSSRKQLLDVFSLLTGVEHLVVVGSGGDPVLRLRERCLEAMALHLYRGGLDRLVLDHVEAVQQRRDRSVLARALSGTGVSYSHEPAHSTEPMLWPPDAIAWCPGRQEWRHHLNGWVSTLAT